MFPSPLWSEDVWTVLSRLPKLRTAIIGEAYSALPTFLEWWAGEVNSPWDPDPCFPSLLKLACENVDFLTFDGRLAPLLIDIIKKQASSPYPLPELQIKGCGFFNRAECSLLRQAAPGLKLVWDEYMEGSDLEKDWMEEEGSGGREGYDDDGEFEASAASDSGE